MIKSKKLILFTLCVLLLIFFSSIAISKADDSYEENDTFNTAATISLNTNYYNLEVSDDDEDWYKVYVNSGNTLNVQIYWSSSSYDIELYLYDSYQTLLDSSTGVSTSETVSEDCILSSGYYYIRVDLINSGTDITYTLYSYTSPCTPSIPGIPNFPFIPFGNSFLLFAGIAIIGLISFIMIKRKKLFKTI
ncbi:MAG: PPC domain-containing protein [Promethearchaeota archaeon]